MKRPIILILVVILGLAAVEGIAWWWMHPAAAGLEHPILTYRPDNTSRRWEITDKDENQGLFPPSRLDKSTATSISASTYTPLPEIVSRASPELRCSFGTAARIDRDDGIVVHIAFFAWDLETSANTLEAFKHLPEQCMGSVGMSLVALKPPRFYQVGNETISFDHTEFKDPVGKPIHAFKGVWVSGASTLLGDGFRGGVDQWRKLRWSAALHRFRPAHARVAQGAIRGIANPDRAWEIFEESMLQDLTFTP